MAGAFFLAIRLSSPNDKPGSVFWYYLYHAYYYILIATSDCSAQNINLATEYD